MSCNRASTASAGPAAQYGAPDVVAARPVASPGQRCGRCRSFLRVDGGCVDCEKTEALLNSPGLPAAARHYLTGPIISHGQWGGELPDWLRGAAFQARREKVEMEMAAKQPGDRATLTEACAYLHAASLAGPLSPTWHRISLYATAQTMQKHKGLATEEFWFKLARDPINALQRDDQRELDHLLGWLRKQTVNAEREKL